MAYDSDNIFAKILRGEIPCKKVYEDDYALAFHDVRPQADIHVLVIPKGEYISNDDFSLSAPEDLIVGFWRAVATVGRELEIVESGYRLLANHGLNAHQTVDHFHVHLFGGHPLGPMLYKVR